MNKLHTLSLLLGFLAAAPAWLTGVHANDISFGDHTWSLSEKGAELVDHRGVPALRLNGGSAELKNAGFRNGVIEFDMELPDARAFGGVTFRRRDGGMAEHFYLRPHLSGKPDANQYQPIFNSNSAWQLLHGPRYSVATNYGFDRWTHVKLVIKNNRMDVYLDSDEPVLHIDPLMHGTTTGNIAFSAFLDEFFVANVKITHDDNVALVGTAAPLPEMPKGLIRDFSVGKTTVASAKVENAEVLDPAMLTAQEWQKMTVGETGAVNLGRLSRRTPEINTLLVKLTIRSDKTRTIRLKYGFSDRLTLFLNGKAIAHEDDTFTSRDYRYLGTIGLFDSVFLPLSEGENEVILAVTEAFGGWGVMAAIEDQTGISVF